MPFLLICNGKNHSTCESISYPICSYKQSLLAIVLHFILCCYSIEKQLNYSNLLTVYFSLNASPLVGDPPPHMTQFYYSPTCSDFQNTSEGKKSQRHIVLKGQSFKGYELHEKTCFTFKSLITISLIKYVVMHSQIWDPLCPGRHADPWTKAGHQEGIRLGCSDYRHCSQMGWQYLSKVIWMTEAINTAEYDKVTK